MNSSKSLRRRHFIQKASAFGIALPMSEGLPFTGFTNFVAADNVNLIGPKDGFSPLIGTMVSMLAWMRMVVLSSVRNLASNDLDYIHDKDANSIGAMLLHLAATEKYYQLHTFDNMKWGTWNKSVRNDWDVPMGLGEKARQTIKGNSLNFYLEKLEAVRNDTIAEFKKRDDAWLLSVDQEWGWGPTNNFCKWFHVCEHESNHNGQIKWIKSRIPGAR